MRSLNEYLAYYDTMRESDERYLPGNYATPRYSRMSVIANGKVVGASLYPSHVLDVTFLETPFMWRICWDYQYAGNLEVRVGCYERSGNEDSQGLVNGEFTLSYIGTLDVKMVSIRSICLW